jgi:hypothetical protein
LVELGVFGFLNVRPAFENPTPQVQFQPHIELGELLLSLGFGLCLRGNNFVLEVEITHWSGITLNYVSREVPGEFTPMGMNLPRHLRNA